MRAVLLLVLASVLQGSTCIYCSGDGCNDDDDDEEPGSHTEVLVLPPLRDALGRPLTGPILLSSGS